MAKERCGDGHERRCTEQAVEETGEFLSAIARRLKGSRGTTAKDVLEEGADTLICIVALMEAIGFSDEDIQRALAEKSKKWLKNEEKLRINS
jgi:phosphoribosyl-ATP pyrophosphohydrolase